jgi:hypothetical protein
MKTNFYKLFCLAFAVIAYTVIDAQTIVKMGSGGGPIGSGPAVTNQTSILYENGTTPSTLRATYQIFNQQFGAGKVEGNPTVPMMSFGGDLNADNAPIGSKPFYSLMNLIGGATNAMFKACGICTGGIDITTDKAINIFSCTDAFIDTINGSNLKGLSERVYIGDVIINFNQPVTNPVLHFVGMGGTTSLKRNKKFYDLGFSTEFDLYGTTATLTKLSGNPYLNVSGNSIVNTAPLLGSAAEGLALNGAMRYSAAGSIRITGTGLMSIKLRTYIKGDGGRICDSANTSVIVTGDTGITPLWSFGNNNPHSVKASVSGDLVLIGISTLKQNIAVPVHILEASATVNATKVTLNWKTENEVNTSRFFVERKVNNGAFESIGTQPAAGDFPGTKYYSIYDDIETILSSAIQYRVKLVDIDGKVTYSNTVTLNTTTKESVKTWPNPITSNLNIAIRSNAATIITTRIFDLSGKLVAQSNNEVVKGNNQLNIGNLNTLANGTYMLHISDAAGTINYTQHITK